MEVLGIDIGFGFTKATNGKDYRVFKSVIGEAAEIQFQEQLFQHPQIEEHLHLEVDGKAFFVGELAERQSNVRSFTLDQDQFIATFVQTLALTAMGSLVERNMPVKVVT